MPNSNAPHKKVGVSFAACYTLATLLLSSTPWTDAKAHRQQAMFDRDYRTEFHEDFDELLGSYGDSQPVDRLVRHPRAAVVEGDESEGGLEAVLRRFSFTDSINRLHSIMKIPELIRSQGYPSEVHKVVTEDGYILELHRIPGPRRMDRVIIPSMPSKKGGRRRSFQKRASEGPSGSSRIATDRETRRRRRKINRTIRSLSSSMYKTSANAFNVTDLDSVRDSLFEVMYDNSDRDEEYIYNLLTNSLEEILSSNKSHDGLGYQSLPPNNRLKRSHRPDDLLSMVGLTNPFRGITNLALPLINKPSVSNNHAKQPTRLIKLADPSPRQPKNRFFKNTSSSLDLSPRRDFEVSSFFGASEGDSGASGKPVVLLHHGLFSSSANFVLNDAHEALDTLWK